MDLAKEERLELQKSGRPILAIKTGGFTPINNKGRIMIEYLMKLQNFGTRPAIDVHIQLLAFALDRFTMNVTLLDSFNERSGNPITQNITLDVGSSFLWSDINTQIILVVKLEYSDKIIKETFIDDYYFSIPEHNKLIINEEHRLFNTGVTDKNLIENYIDKNE